MAATITIMTDPQDLLRLLSWLSPAFPTGAFSYSHGLETAIANELVTSRDELKDWLAALLTNGPGWNDAVLLAQSWRQANGGKDLQSVAELAQAMATTKERHLETMAQGRAFVAAAREWQSDIPDDLPLPVAVGCVCGRLGISLDAAVAAYLQAYVSNQIQAALRLMPLGQQNGVWLLKALEPAILDAASAAAKSSLVQLGNSAFMADVQAMQHETLNSRMFRS